MSPALDVRRGADRATTVAPGRVTAHSFSFGAHYDPANVGLGPLVALNDDRVEPGGGYADHPHRDVEIVTWVLSGALTHQDSTGAATTVGPGRVQVQSAGAGVVHRETVADGGEPTRFVQCWLTPRTPGGPPSYAVADVDPTDGWVTLACGRHAHDDVPRIDVAATAYAARVRPGRLLTLPGARRILVLVTAGTVRITADDEQAELADGDSVRLTGAGDAASVAGAGSLLVWALD